MSIVIFILLCPARLNYLFQSVWGLGSKHCANTCINNVPQVTYLFLYMMHVFIKMKKGDSIQVFYSGRKFSSKWENLYLITLFFSYLQDSDLGYWCFCFEEYFLLSFFFFNHRSWTTEESERHLFCFKFGTLTLEALSCLRT